MTYTIGANSPKAASAAAFGHELVKACQARGIPRTELHRVTGIGRTALDNYRTGSSLPKTEAAATLASVLDWPRLREIVEQARTRACRRCGRPFRNDGGNMGAKRYCSVACRETAASEAAASRRTRQAGQTDDNRRRYQALAQLRSGIRIAEERAATLQAGIDAMCRDCEPLGLCRMAACPLRAFSPLPLASHESDVPATIDQVRARRWTPEARAATGARTAQMHREGRIPKPTDLPAHDPARREAWIESIRQGRARNPKHGPLTPEHRAAISAGHRRRNAKPEAAA